MSIVKPPHLLAAPDKFRGTATAREVADACHAAAADHGWHCDPAPISDGGEGFLDCFGGANQVSTVSGPLGAAVRAGWRLDGRRAVIEMATASGLALVAGANDAMAASTRGTGELIRAALDAGATEILLGVGGSASTDGGAGALGQLDGIRFDVPAGPRLIVAVDVQARFLDAAPLFGPQKGASPTQVNQLAKRLTTLAADYARDFGVDVTALGGGGAAGGLAGGLAAIGASLQPGFAVVAERLGLAERIAAADLVVSGEGRFDATSLLGKAAAALAELAATVGTETVLVVGAAEPGVPAPAAVVSLHERFGAAVLRDVPGAVRIVVGELLAARRPSCGSRHT